MRKAIGISLMTAAVVAAATNVRADDDLIMFRYTGHETCVAGPPGTFTPDGDVRNSYFMLPALGSGVMTFNHMSHTASETNAWAYQIMPGPPLPPNQQPQGLNIFPAGMTTGSCSFIFQRGQKKSFTLQQPQAGCTATNTNGPYPRLTVTFTNAPLVQGQFAEDMQSFVAYRIGLTVENAWFSTGGQRERICMREYHGVRIPDWPN